MGLDDLTAREDIRRLLENLCRDTVALHESKNNMDFDPDTVELKCFGSLGTGLATLSSDLDLALVSPHSVPECSSVESKIPRLLEKRLLDMGFGARLLTQTRVPIIKFCQEPTPELAKALLEERAKWEKERDSSLKPKTDQIGTMKDGEKPNGRPRDVSAKGKANAGSQSKLEEQHGTSRGDSKASPKNEEVRAQNDVVRSDEELVFLYNTAMAEGWYDAQERKTIHNFLTAVTKQESPLDRDRLHVARLELESVTDILHRYRAPREDVLNFPKEGVGIQCDINFSNYLALHNTTLLKCYSICDPRIRPMIVFVKAWAKRRKINSPYHGTLSSYGYVLMVLHYLVNIADPPIAPNLQRTRKAAEDDSPGNEDIIDGYSVRFWRSMDEIQRLADHGMLTRNTKDNVGSLLRGFFHYYALEGFWSPAGGFNWWRDILSLRTQGGTLFKQTKGWTGAKVTTEPTIAGREPREIKHRYLLAIEDPFETDHNIARTVVYRGLNLIRDEFRRAHSIIDSVKAEKNAKPVYDLFAEAENGDNLGRRCFGPLLNKTELEIQSKDKQVAGSNGKPACIQNNQQTRGHPFNGKPARVPNSKPTFESTFNKKSFPIGNDQQATGNSSGAKPVIHSDKPTALAPSSGENNVVAGSSKDESLVPSNKANQGAGPLSIQRKSVPDRSKPAAGLLVIETEVGANSDNGIARSSSERKRDPNNKSKLPPRSALQQAQQILNDQAKATAGLFQHGIPITGKSNQLEKKLPSVGDNTAVLNKGDPVEQEAPEYSAAEEINVIPGTQQNSTNGPMMGANRQRRSAAADRRWRYRKYLHFAPPGGHSRV